MKTKTTVLNIALAGVLLVPAAYGVDEHHPEKATPGVKAPKASASPQADDKSVARMQEHLKKMQGIMGRMQKTTDPAERQKLMTEHMQAMQEGMKTMRGMSGIMQGMMGGGMMGAGMMGQAPKEAGKPGMSDGGPMSPAMLESRMEMMQMMMEQMMQHQKALESAPKLAGRNDPGVRTLKWTCRAANIRITNTDIMDGRRMEGKPLMPGPR
jgi:hypothetical protein